MESSALAAFVTATTAAVVVLVVAVLANTLDPPCAVPSHVFETFARATIAPTMHPFRLCVVPRVCLVGMAAKAATVGSDAVAVHTRL